VDIVTKGFVKAFNHFDQFKKCTKEKDAGKHLMGCLKRIIIQN
jgi:hypothetical protein